MGKTKLSNERTDVVTPIRSMSFNCPGHRDRLKGHCERVQREYFDKKMHPAGEKLKLMRDGRSRD